jgi:spore maturation protein SpmA
MYVLLIIINSTYVTLCALIIISAQMDYSVAELQTFFFHLLISLSYIFSNCAALRRCAACL